MNARTGIGYDSHRLSGGRRLVLGGVEIEGAARGLTGHSDADVLAHAVIDALLGAAALGDIGQHFPDTDQRFKDADSIVLLREAVSMLGAEGLAATHLDATVIAEAPKLGRHRDEIRDSLAAAVGLERSAVSIKFTTNEGMGFLGRQEGMAAMAIATVEQKGA